MQGCSEAMETLLELHGVQPQELGRLSQGDLAGKIGPKSAGVRIFHSLDPLPVIDHALREDRTERS
jgi:hypothetical protein